MMHRWRPNSAHVISLIALFVALGGSAYAISLGKNAVKSKNIAKGAVKTSDLANKAVSRKKLKAGAVPASAIANNSIGAEQLGTVVVRRVEVPLNESSGAEPAVQCPPGEQALGGGGLPSAGQADVTMNYTRPADSQGGSAEPGGPVTGWGARFNNTGPGGAGNGVAFAYVICLQ